MTMNVFDKICAVLAIILGGLFMILGGLGLFTGCKAHFTLPPILGGLPLLVGWGIIKAIVVAWNKPSSEQKLSSTTFERAGDSDYRMPVE